MSPITNFLQNFAASCQPGAGGSFLGFPTWYKYLDGEIVGGKCSVVFDFPNDIGTVLLAIVEILLRIAGLIAVVFVIIGGARYLTSQGEPENTKAALHTIINSLIGLVISLFAVIVVGFIARRLT